MTVYVVTKGAYSDYGIVCVRMTRAEADTIVAMLPGATVEEFDTEGHPYAGDGMFWWEISAYTDDEEVRAELSTICGSTPVRFFAYEGNALARLYGDVRATDKQHALKIASEKRAELIVWLDQQRGKPS